MFGKTARKAFCLPPPDGRQPGPDSGETAGRLRQPRQCFPDSCLHRNEVNLRFSQFAFYLMRDFEVIKAPFIFAVMPGMTDVSRLYKQYSNNC